jgi:hypothetical protein
MLFAPLFFEIFRIKKPKWKSLKGKRGLNSKKAEVGVLVGF